MVIRMNIRGYFTKLVHNFGRVLHTWPGLVRLAYAWLELMWLVMHLGHLGASSRVPGSLLVARLAIWLATGRTLGFALLVVRLACWQLDLLEKGLVGGGKKEENGKRKEKREKKEKEKKSGEREKEKEIGKREREKISRGKLSGFKI